MESDKGYTVVEILCVEDTNVLDSCVQFLTDYKQLDLFNWIVKIEVVCGVHWDIFCVIYNWVSMKKRKISNCSGHTEKRPTFVMACLDGSRWMYNSHLSAIYKTVISKTKYDRNSSLPPAANKYFDSCFVDSVLRLIEQVKIVFTFRLSEE